MCVLATKIDNRGKMNGKNVKKNQFCDYHKNVRFWNSFGIQVGYLRRIARRSRRFKREKMLKWNVSRSFRFTSYDSLSFQILFAGCTAQKWLICFFPLFLSSECAHLFSSFVEVFSRDEYAHSASDYTLYDMSVRKLFFHRTISVAFDTSRDASYTSIKYIIRIVITAILFV